MHLFLGITCKKSTIDGRQGERRVQNGRKLIKKIYVLEPATAPNFPLFFPVSFALDDRLLIYVFPEDIELVCQIQRDLDTLD